jgi:alpha-galactosidase
MAEIADTMVLRHDPAGPSWTLAWRGRRFDIHLREAALVCDHFGPDRADPPPLWPGWREHELLLNARLPAMVEVGARPVGVAWALASWHQPDPWSLSIALAGVDIPLACEARFAVDPPTGLLLRGTTLRHAGGDGPVDITGALSFWLTLRGGAAAAHMLSGVWGGEAQAEVHPGGHASLVLDSRSGKTGFEFQPWLALESPDGVHLCEVLWSGNWSLLARLRPGTTTLSGGLNDWGFAHMLQPGAELVLPEGLLGFVPGTLDDAVRRLHDWRRARRPAPSRPVPVQFNTWYALDEDVDEARVLALVPRAAALGCEVFVLDAGWYTTHAWSPLANWHARAGDWLIDPARFPRGLAHVADSCRAAGMGFGLWCEPEAVGACAAIRREHPEWMHHIDGRPPAEDGRAVLHLGVPGAWAHAFALLAELVRATGAAWLKWDFNADLASGGWAPGLPADLAGQDPLVAHYRGLYRLQEALLAAFPDLTLEMCASGGGRMDAAILARAHTNWISDNPQAVAKLAIHFGMQRAHPAVACNDWLVDWPPRSYPGVAGLDLRGDLAFRLCVAMLGSFGISAPIGAWTAEDTATVRAQVMLYRERLRALVHHGDQYQLTAPPPLDGEGDWAAMWFLARDGSHGALFAFRLAGAQARDFPLPGLAPGARIVRGEGATRTADGVRVMLEAPFSAALLLLE